MFSLTTRIVALPGQRDALAEILLKGSRNLPGCLTYVVANDPCDESSVWINEVWESDEPSIGAVAGAGERSNSRGATNDRSCR
jgi:quinol monooxygenase YgiN